MSEERFSRLHYLTYGLAMAICGIMRLLPPAAVWRAFSLGSRLAYLIDGKHRRVALRNLEIAFGDGKSGAEKRAIARGSFRNLFLTFAEFIMIPVIMRDLDSFVRITNLDSIRRAVGKGRGVIFLISHFGNWELMAHSCAASGFKLAAVGRPLKNPLLYREVMRLRGYNGAVTLQKKWVAREIIDKLKRNWCVAILMDQYAGRQAPFVPFFGRPVSTTPAPALLAMRTGAAVLPVFNVREAPGRLHIYVGEPVAIVETGERDSDVRENCARFNRIIEEWVRRFPEQWVWMHRRWRRKKAPGEP